MRSIVLTVWTIITQSLILVLDLDCEVSMKNNYVKYETLASIPDLDLLQKLRYFPEPILKPSADPTVQNFLNRIQDKDKIYQRFTLKLILFKTL